MRPVHCDLVADWVKHVKAELARVGHSVEGLGEGDVIRKFLNLQKRSVQPVPREIRKSAGFSCPPQLQNGLALLEQELVKGADISPYLSRRLTDLEYTDPMLNHWGIHHLHLGERKDSDGFMDRTGDLLFCRFDDEVAYFIGVYGHGAWTKQDLVRILHRNWPDSIRNMRMPGILASQTPVSDADVKTLRKKNVNPPLEMDDGTVYAPLGGGVAMSGDSTDVVTQEIFTKKHLQDLERALRENIEEIASKAEQKGVRFPDDPRFELYLQGGGVYVIEEETNVCVPLNV